MFGIHLKETFLTGCINDVSWRFVCFKIRLISDFAERQNKIITISWSLPNTSCNKISFDKLVIKSQKCISLSWRNMIVQAEDITRRKMIHFKNYFTSCLLNATSLVAAILKNILRTNKTGTHLQAAGSWDIYHPRNPWQKLMRHVSKLQDAANLNVF